MLTAKHVPASPGAQVSGISSDATLHCLALGTGHSRNAAASWRGSVDALWAGAGDLGPLLNGREVWGWGFGSDCTLLGS
jgi:hypothetical protein